MVQSETPDPEAMPTAGIVFQDGRYFAALWFVNSADKSRDWLGAIWKDEGGDWQGVYRFRYYNDGKIVDSTDDKSWYGVTIPGEAPEHLVVRPFNAIAEMFSKEYGGEIHKVPLRTSDAMKCIEALKREPWFHVVGGA